MKTGVCDGGYEAVRRRHVADFEAMLPEYAGRIGWSADRVARERRRALRALLVAARGRLGTGIGWLGWMPAPLARRMSPACR